MLYIHCLSRLNLTSVLRCQHPKPLTSILKMEAACNCETLYSPVHGVITHINIHREHMELYGLLVKVKVKVKFTLEQATKTQRESRGIGLLFL